MSVFGERPISIRGKKHTDIDEWKVEAGGDFKKLKRNANLLSTEMAT